MKCRYMKVFLPLLIASITLTALITYRLSPGTTAQSLQALQLQPPPEAQAPADHDFSGEEPKPEALGEPEVDRPEPPPAFAPPKLDLDLLTPHILNEPPWVRAKAWGIVEDAAHNQSALPRPLREVPQDGEVETAWTHFFRGMTNGLMLELGAMNGVSYSASKPFEEYAGWKTILIEAQHAYAPQLRVNRPDSLSLRLIACEKPTTYHFLEAQDVGGIIEFMAPDFFHRFHKTLLKDGAAVPRSSNGVTLEDIIDWEKVKESKYVFEEPCLPLQSVFDRFEIPRINFMVLDLEGGELGALKSLDFDRIRFDVLCIETNRMNNDADPYINQVVDFVTGKGYALYKGRTIGRNSWFVHPDWTRIFK